MVDFFLDYFSKTPGGMKVLVVCGGFAVAGGVIKIVIKTSVKTYYSLKDYFAKKEQKRIEDKEFKKSVLEMKAEVGKMSAQIQNIEGLTAAVKSVSQTSDHLKDRLNSLEASMNELRDESNSADKVIISTMEHQKETMNREQKHIEKMETVLNILVDSDEADFRGKLLETLEKCKLQGNKIDALTLSNILTGFKRYRAEGGNSWAENIIKEILKMEIIPYPNIDYDVDTQHMIESISEYIDTDVH